MDRKLWTEPSEERVLLDGVALPRRSLLNIRGGRGAVLFIEHGEVWVTQEGDLRDVVLPGGAWFGSTATAPPSSRRAAPQR